MYKEKYLFHTPEDSVITWRYLDFTKFVDLVLTNQLYFTRSDNFEDPFEGVFRLKDYESNKKMFETQELTKQFYFLNCWHINDKQSDAMWKIFLKTNNGIAIMSTVGNIKKSLEASQDNIHIGKVYYRDYDKVTFDELLFEDQNKFGNGGGISQFSYKRVSFEHEKELRLYYIDMPIPHVILNGKPRDPISHKRINVNLSELINEIVIAPFADIWFKELVEKVIKRCDLNFNITKSNLYTLQK